MVPAHMSILRNAGLGNGTQTRGLDYVFLLSILVRKIDNHSAFYKSYLRCVLVPITTFHETADKPFVGIVITLWPVLVFVPLWLLGHLFLQDVFICTFLYGLWSVNWLWWKEFMPNVLFKLSGSDIYYVLHKCSVVYIFVFTKLTFEMSTVHRQHFLFTKYICSDIKRHLW